MAPASSIASYGRSCCELFPRLCGLLEASEFKDQVSPAAASGEFKRFELWAKNIAALQDAHLPSSLEYRIREDESAREAVKNALVYLEESLQIALSIASGEKANETWDVSVTSSDNSQSVNTPSSILIRDKPRDFGTSQTSELIESFLAIQDGITNLFELSMIIRKKPERDEYIKASLEYQIDPTADVIHVGDKYPAAKKGESWLMERLGTAITRRRQYLRYRKEHQQKMEQVHPVRTDADGRTVWSGEKASTYLPNENLDDYRPLVPTQQGFSQRARTEYADSSWGKDGASKLLRTPLLPRKDNGIRFQYGEHFECPYCWRVQKVYDKNAWKYEVPFHVNPCSTDFDFRKHVFSDLRPYVCTFEACGLNMFDSQHQWFSHELQFHRSQWVCRYCEEKAPATRSDLETHLKDIHKEKVERDDVDTIVNACQIGRIDATRCPLCDDYGAQLRRINQSLKCDVSLKQFQEHLGRHMEQLALAALPQDDDNENNVLKEEDSGESDVEDRSIKDKATGEEADLDESRVKKASRLLETYVKRLGNNHPDTLNSMLDLAKANWNEGNIAEAEATYERALAGYEKAFGPDHPSTLNAVNNFGSLYSNQRRFAEAEAMYKRALAGYQKALGPNHPSTLNAVNNLGNLYSDQGKFTEAEAMYERALAEYEKTLGPEHRSTLGLVSGWGRLYSDQGKLAEAEAMYERALAGYEKSLGPDHPLTLYAVNDLGRLYSDQGKFAEAEAIYERALAGFEKSLGPDNPSTLNTVSSLGRLYSDQGKLAEAEAMYERALAGYEKSLGPDHLSTLGMVSGWGRLYSNQGKLAEAEAMYERALAGFEKSLGPDKLSTLNTVSSLGRLYSDQGKLAEAEAMYERALAGYEKFLGPDHPSTLGIASGWGRLYSNQGKLAEAEAMYERALAGYEKALGPDHRLTLYTVKDLGSLYSNQGKLTEAEALYGRHHAWARKD